MHRACCGFCLILITLGLAGLAPLGFRSEQMTEFRQGDFLDARAVARQMQREYKSGTPSPGYRICSSLDEERAATDMRHSVTRIPMVIDPITATCGS